MTRHRIFVLLAAVAVAIGTLSMTLGAAAAIPDDAVQWTGRGVDDGQLDTVDCDASEAGFGLFIYTGDSDTAPVLSIDGFTYVGVQQGNDRAGAEPPRRQ